MQSRNKKEKINRDYITRMLRAQKWRQCDICEPILGIKCGTFSSQLGRGYMDSKVIDKLSALLKVDRNFLLADDFISEGNPDPNPETESDSGIVLNSHGVEHIKCIYNLATSIEAALTNFRRDLLELIGGEESDGQI
ncbi:MAG: hypothetical protein LUD72_05855 [Bacteroidales bacterium]|nr:hypothetical protein [Bacteroidales bacterium]